VNATLRFGLVAYSCAGLTACAILPVAGLNLAAQGAQGLVALTLGPLVAMQDRSEKDRCQMFTARGVSITESLETGSPTNEGEIRMFEPVFWRPEFALEGYPEVEQSRTPTEGTLAVTERSVVFVPPPGATSVRIPYELVQDVAVNRNAVTGEPRSMIVKSCFGRFDIVTFRLANKLDPEATTAAASQLKARVAAFHAIAEN
jgi:hypothetical protein